jgi:hypothetical protein
MLPPKQTTNVHPHQKSILKKNVEGGNSTTTDLFVIY